MKRIATVLLLVSSTSAASPATATIEGDVQVDYQTKVVSPDDVWVYLVQKDPRPKSIPAGKDVAIHQVNYQFCPHVRVVPIGTTVWFPNDQKVDHNVFSPTDPPEAFNLKAYNYEPKGKSHAFPKEAADMEIYCDVHPWMWAHVKLVKAQEKFIVRVDSHGHYAFTDVPLNTTFDVHAWTYDSKNEGNYLDVKVTSATKYTVPTRNLHLEHQRPPTPPHKRWDTTDYKGYPSGNANGTCP
jgi:plastocyanin